MKQWYHFKQLTSTNVSGKKNLNCNTTCLKIFIVLYVYKNLSKFIEHDEKTEAQKYDQQTCYIKWPFGYRPTHHYLLNYFEL